MGERREEKENNRKILTGFNWKGLRKAKTTLRFSVLKNWEDDNFKYNQTGVTVNGILPMYVKIYILNFPLFFSSKNID